MKNVTKMILFRLLSIALFILSLVVPALTCKFIYWLIFTYEWHGIIGWKVPAHFISIVLEMVDDFVSAKAGGNMAILIPYAAGMMFVIVAALAITYSTLALICLLFIMFGFIIFYEFSVDAKNKSIYCWEEIKGKDHKERTRGKDAAEKVFNKVMNFFSLEFLTRSKGKKYNEQANSQSYYQDDFSQWQEEDARRRAEYEQYYRQQEQSSNSYQQADN